MRLPELLIQLFKDNIPNGVFRVIREGDPIIPPQTLLPAMYITERSTGYDVGSTHHDHIIHDVLIQVVFNKKDELGNPDESFSLDKTIDDIVQGRDNDLIRSNTIIGVLRQHYTLDNMVFNNEVTVRKGIIARSEELLTAEAHIECVFTENLNITNRV